MKEYYLKVGNMYVEDIMTSAEYPENNFIRCVSFTMNIFSALKYYEDSLADIKKILYITLGIEVTFQEVEI